MLNNNEVQPALTAEEWADTTRADETHYSTPEGVAGAAVRWWRPEKGMRLKLAFFGNHVAEVCCGCFNTVYDGGSRHGIAAIALHGQPFGFTHDDVALLRGVSESSGHWTDSNRDALDRLAARIAALLPPE